MSHSTPAETNKAVLHRYLDLPQGDCYGATYVWIDGTDENVRCKTRTLDSEAKSPKGKTFQLGFVAFIICQAAACLND